MCGITGWVDFKKPLVQEQSVMEKMTDTLSNRGPDDTNIWGKRHVYSDINAWQLWIWKAADSR